MVGQPKPLQLTTGQRRGIVLVTVVGVAVVLIAVLVSVLGKDSYASRNGCVTVTFASSTGGANLHECGAQAQAWCTQETYHPDVLAARVLVQCRKAGVLVPSVAPTVTSSGLPSVAASGSTAS